MNIIGIIPARMASSRFPGKPLAKILGIPMIGHVYFRSRLCKSIKKLYIATCDNEIADYAVSIGAGHIMTKSTHERASDRAAEAMLKIEAGSGKQIDIVVMIQGDEPMIYPEMIDLAISPLIKDKSVQVANLMSQIKSKKDQQDPNQVKVVSDINGFALYFSRQPIPSAEKASAEITLFKQVPVIPFRRDSLIEFNRLEPTPLEIIESVDMLRLLEHGREVKMVQSPYDTYAVDTASDLKNVEKLMGKDKLVKEYNK